MNKFFSCAVESFGYCCAFGSIYRRSPDCEVFIASDGDDYERAVFFDRLIKNLKGFSLDVFNPFFDESPDGIYIENTDTYILSDSGFNRCAPVMAGAWEKYFSVTGEKEYPKSVKEEITARRNSESAFYKDAGENLKKAERVRERLHSELAGSFNDEKAVNFIRRFCSKNLKSPPAGTDSGLRLLSAVTPLGVHTHYDTIFSMCDKTVDIQDPTGFAGAVITSVIKDYAKKRNIPFIMSPCYFSAGFAQFLIFPGERLCLSVSDENHILPFKARESVGIPRFFANEALSGKAAEKTRILLDAENSFIEKAVMSVYKGRDERFAAGYAAAEFSDAKKAEESADRLCERILS